MIIKPSQGLLTEMKRLVANRQMIDMEMEIVKQKILRQAGNTDLDAELQVDIRNWEVRIKKTTPADLQPVKTEEKKAIND